MGTKVKPSDITIIVPTRGRKSNVERLLAAVKHRPLILVSEEGRISEDLPLDLKGATVELAPPSCGSAKAGEVGLEAATTSHVIFVCDDADILDPDFVEKISDYIDTIPGGENFVVIPNDGHRGVDFPFLPKKFYMEEMYPTPYKKYCLDNEITEKAKRLNRIIRADHVRLIHRLEGVHDDDTNDADCELLIPRLADFVHRRPTEVTRKMFVALPIYRQLDCNFFSSMNQLAVAHTCNCQVEIHVGECPIGRARNDLTRKFLDSDCTHILFIDSDICFSPDQVTRLLNHDEDVVGGFYPIKSQGLPRMCINPVIGEDGRPNTTETKNGLLEISYIGTGFLRVSRRAFELMIQHFGEEIWYTRDVEPMVREYNFWHMGPYTYPDGSRRWLSEDWWFCQRWKDIGGKVYGDLHVALKHAGTVLFPLESQEKYIFKQARLETSASAAAPTVPSPPTGAPLAEAIA